MYESVSDKQALLATITRWYPANQIYIAEGAIRTGKTEFLSDGFADWIRLEGRNEENYFAVAQNMTNLMKNVLGPIIKYFQLFGYQIRPNGKDNYWHFTKEAHSFYIWGYSANNKSSFERIQGGTYRGGFIDEAALMNLEMLETCQGRCISHLQEWKIFMTSNPEGSEHHWFYQSYLTDALKKGYIHVNFHLLDNPIFTVDYVNRFRIMFSDTMYQRKIVGKWVAGEGACYATTPQLIIPKKDEFIEQIIAGLDDGDNDACSVVAVGITNLQRFVILDQYYQKTTDGEPISPIVKKDDIVKFFENLSKEYDCPIELNCETNPATQYLMLKKEADWSPTIDIRIRKVRKNMKLADTSFKTSSAIQERIDVVNIMLNTKMLLTANVQLPIISAIANAVYDDKGKRLDNGTSDIDSLDSLEYALSRWMKEIINFIMEEGNNGLEKEV